MRRPTINFFEWKFSVDLEETRGVQNKEGLPAFGCDCTDCSSWRKNYEHNLPRELLNSFSRIGIDLDHPSDCYGANENFRVIFHWVGKIQSGPDSKIFSNKINDFVMNYVPIRHEPWLSVIVIPARDSYEPSPKKSDGTDDEVICIDIRLNLVKNVQKST
jgi:hypothetical protein